MSPKKNKIKNPKTLDSLFLTLILIAVFAGFFIFSSASLGLLARNSASLQSVTINQFFLGVIGGIIAMFITSNIHYRNWRQYAFYIFLFSAFLTLAVFIPGLGMSSGGATRWLDLKIATVQPSEIFKIAFIIYTATLLSGLKKIDTWKYGFLPFAIVLGISGIIMLSLPDTDNFLVMVAAGFAMFLTAGARLKHIFSLVGVGALFLALVVSMRPYLLDRITTVFNPEQDALGSGYQIQQSLIAIGGGGLTGRGYGQSIQKFEYLPEPISDSIFSVYAEEFGFLGSLLLIIFFTFLATRGLKIANNTQDLFGALLTVGIITLFITQTFINIASMTGIFPLSGLALPFVSHGGTALFSTLAAFGIILNVSKYRRNQKTL